MNSIKTKIYVSFGSLIFILLLLSIYSFYNTKIMNENISTIVKDDLFWLMEKEKLVFNVSERLALARGYILNGNEEYKNRFYTLTKESRKTEEILLSVNENVQLHYLIERSKAWENYVTSMVFPEYESGNQQQAIYYLEEIIGSIGMEITDGIHELMYKEQTKVFTKADDMVQNNEKLLVLNIIILTSAIIIGIAIAFILSKKIAHPILQIVQRVKSVADGELKIIDFDIKSKDEIGQLAWSVNQMVINLRNLIIGAINTSNQVVSSSQKLQLGADETSEVTEQITQSIQEVAAGSKNIVKNITEGKERFDSIVNDLEEIKEDINDVQNLSNQTTEKAEKGLNVIGQTKNHMKKISNKTEEVTLMVDYLAEKSTKVDVIVTLISGIAEQTKLLSLNAAIEAAKAGEHGKGFSIVANEIRKLAEQTSKSAEQIKGLVYEIQHDINSCILAVQSGHASVKDGNLFVDEAGNEFSSITTSIKQVTDKINNISIAIAKISGNMNLMVESNKYSVSIAEDGATNIQIIATAAEEQNFAMSEVTSSANSLMSISDELQNIIKNFKLN